MKEKNKDYSKKEDYIALYHKVSLGGYFEIRKLKKDINNFNQYILNKIKENGIQDIRASSLTIYSDKINQFYHEKKKSFYSNLFNSLIVLGTFLMVIVTFISIK